ncbi:MAG: adenosylcobinamide-GDP ribazoletransferase [Candidatus Omnitrophota bacterium]|jgi:adenosylcobinamide-GDP ribazoletransferase
MKRFLIALQFLTIFPIRLKSDVNGKDLGASLIYFPVVGALIGMILAAISAIFGFLPYTVMIALVLISSIALTGAIHLDGFADTCDGFFGSRSKEKILEIMRDSRIGTMGAAGIACLLLLKFTVLVSIPHDILWKALVMMAAFSRMCQCLACYMSGYAREEGKAEGFIKYAGIKEALGAAVITLALFTLLMGLKGIIIFFIALPPVLLFIYYIKNKIGGMTGDTIGAASELAEIVLLLFVLIHIG